MTRLRRILAAAAALIVGGTGIYQAIDTANQADAQPLSGAEWAAAAARLKAARPVEFYVLVDESYAPPQAHGGRILGECSNDPAQGGTRCRIPTPAGTYSYPYARVAGVPGRRLFRAAAHPWVVGGWKRLGEDVAEVTWLGAMMDVRDACLAAGHSLAQCGAVMDAINPCWEKPDGTRCRNGITGRVLPGGAPETCAAPEVGDVWVACSTTPGEDHLAKGTAAAIPADDELDF